jgi:hypothetical protein
MKLPIIALSLSLCATVALAEDHLEPSVSALSGAWSDSDYNAIVVDALKEAYEPDVRVRVIDFASFENPETAIGVKEDGGAYRIFTLHPAYWLFYYTKAGKSQVADAIKDGHSEYASMPPDYHKVEVKRCEVGIDHALGSHIVEAWKQMLLDTKYNESPNGTVDGDWYVFSMKLGDQNLEGQIANPHGGNASLLVQIAYTMDQFCRTKDAKFTVQLNEDVDALLAQLKTSTASGTKP